MRDDFALCDVLDATENLGEVRVVNLPERTGERVLAAGVQAELGGIVVRRLRQVFLPNIGRRRVFKRLYETSVTK